MTNIFTLKEFTEVMSAWKNLSDFKNKANDLLDAMFVDEGYTVFDPPDIINWLEVTLEKMFCDDDLPWIEYFVYDLEWGTKYEDGTIKDGDGNIIKLATIEDLYNVLIKEIRENGKL